MSWHCREDDDDGGGPSTKVPRESIDDNPTRRHTRSSLPALDLEKCLLCDSKRKTKSCRSHEALTRCNLESSPTILLSAARIIGSAEALPILCVRYFRWERERYRERERDGSDVIFALKLAMNSHFHLPKIRTIGDELTLSLAKNSHFSFLPSHFPSLPSRRGHHCGAEIRNEFTLSIAKNVFARFVPPLSNGTSRATSDRKPKTNDQILPSPLLFFPSKKWIKLIPKTIGNRKRDCAWGGSGW